MTRKELLAEFFELINSESVNGVISPRRALVYLAEGQDEFCERTGYIRDKTNYTVTLATDTATYSLSGRIYEVLDVWDGTRRLSKVNIGDVLLDDGSGGDPIYWQTDQETDQIRLYPTPTSDQNGDVFTLQVWRYSQNDLAASGAEPEVPSRFHLALVEWAAYKAFSNHDMEAQDAKAASDHYANFIMYIRRAKVHFRRRHGLEVRVGVDRAYVV